MNLQSACRFLWWPTLAVWCASARLRGTSACPPPASANSPFILESSGLKWTVDNIRDDQAVGLSGRTTGTFVRCEIDAQTSRSTSEVFAAYSIDHDFVRTRTVVRLFDIGVRFISRSEARRLLRGLERFREVLVDLRGVQEVGQGFVDEVFRVWPSQHPDVTVRPMNMVGPVEAMVRRGLPKPERRLGPERSSDG